MRIIVAATSNGIWIKARRLAGSSSIVACLRVGMPIVLMAKPNSTTAATASGAM